MDTFVIKEFLSTEQVAEKKDHHRGMVSPWTRSFRNRRARGVKHPVEDFLFTYYNYSSSQLEEWHPGLDIILSPEGYKLIKENSRYAKVENGWTLNPYLIDKKEKLRIEFIHKLLQSTDKRAGIFHCYGLHEWAMVYKTNNIRHAWPLRMKQKEIDEFVHSQKIYCTHFDAFRFFTSAARPLNQSRPTAENRLQYEQPGCIHANLDLYKWAYKMAPWCGSDLIVEAFKLAVRGRTIDMQASPYDLSDLGIQPILIESRDGREQYQKAQKELTQKASLVREKLIGLTRKLIGSATINSNKVEKTVF